MYHVSQFLTIKVCWRLEATRTCARVHTPCRLQPWAVCVYNLTPHKTAHTKNILHKAIQSHTLQKIQPSVQQKRSYDK